ncbi:phosphohydrolase, partial [Patescibacteria group bacterium]|nr:phosphohydrolase [Patescibacteria group bacterium]
TKDNPQQHGPATVQYLKEQGINNEEMFQAILSHNQEMTGISRDTDLDMALTAAEQISGLIVGCALVMPDKKLASVSLETVTKKFKQPAFTANVDRELIRLSEKLGLTLTEFMDLSLRAMRGAAEDLGL